MEKDTNSSSRAVMEAQLQWPIKVVMDSFDTTTKEMRQSTQEGFSKVQNKLDSIYNVVAGRGAESEVV